MPNSRRKGRVAAVSSNKSWRGQAMGPQPAAIMPGQDPSPEHVGRSPRNDYLLFIERDRDCLSSYQCLLRQQIELFEATEEDVIFSMPGRTNGIVLGQVGIRCRHCPMLPSRRCGTGATSYPTKLDRLYQAALRMAKNHFAKNCQHVPQEVVNKLSAFLKGSKSGSQHGGGMKYWSDGARKLGACEINEMLWLDRSRATNESKATKSSTQSRTKPEPIKQKVKCYPRERVHRNSDNSQRDIEEQCQETLS